MTNIWIKVVIGCGMGIVGYVIHTLMSYYDQKSLKKQLVKAASDSDRKLVTSVGIFYVLPYKDTDVKHFTTGDRYQVMKKRKRN